MTIQTLTLGKRRFVVVAERDFQRLQKLAAKRVIRPDFADDAMRELKAYRKSGKAAEWPTVKRRLGL